MRSIDEKGLNLIKSFEGCKLHAYQDQAGVWTCGWGATGKDIHEGTVWTQTQADQRLELDLLHFENGVSQLVDVYITDNQFSALVSFSYNLGLGSLASSTLLRYINADMSDKAGDEFLKWDKVNGVENPGILRRRTAERELFLEE